MVGTIEQAIEMSKRPQSGDELTDADFAVIGRSRRIDIPIRDIYRLRKVAEMLRALGDRIDFRTRDTRASLRSQLYDISLDIWNTNQRIREMYDDVLADDHRLNE